MHLFGELKREIEEGESILKSQGFGEFKISDFSHCLFQHYNNFPIQFYLHALRPQKIGIK